jgi:hypothetical protein
MMQFKISGQALPAPTDWGDLEILATFDNDSVQANISTSELTFVNEAAKYIRDWISTGAYGIFEGIPFEITEQGQGVFLGFLDLYENFREIDPVHVQCTVKQDDGLVSLSDRAEGITMRLLVNDGFITSADYVDIEYIVAKKFNFVEFALLSLTTFLMLQQLIALTKDIGKNAAIISGDATDVPPNPAGAAASAALLIIADAVYAAVIIIYLVNLGNEIISYIYPPKRKHKGIKIDRMMQRFCQKIGYSWTSPAGVPEFTNIYYCPSKDLPGQLVGAPTTDTGIPRSSDYGYTVNELMQLIRDTWAGKFVIQGNVLRFEPLINDAYWQQTASFVIPDVLNEVKIYNTQDLKARKLVRFEQDINDQWTLDEVTGFYFERITQPIVVGNQRRVTMRGLSEVALPVSLGSRKSGYSDLELVLIGLAGTIDSVVNAFGGNSNLAGSITQRIGLLQISSNQINVPKLLYMTGTPLRIPSNHRSALGAKALENNYHVDDSFVRNNWRGQKWLFEGVEIPFGLANFNQLLSSSYCTTAAGENAKISELKWVMGRDKALISGWVRKPYTTNLKEIFYEQGNNQ